MASTVINVLPVGVSEMAEDVIIGYSDVHDHEHDETVWLRK